MARKMDVQATTDPGASAAKRPFSAAHGYPSLRSESGDVPTGVEREGSGRRKVLKQLLTPEAWEQRMERQRQRRANPDIRAKELAAERERWKRDPKRVERKKIVARTWRKTPAGQRYQKARNAKRDKARLTELQREWYVRNREKIIAKEARKRWMVAPSYAAHTLKLPLAEVPQEVVALVRAHLQLKRELRSRRKP